MDNATLENFQTTYPRLHLSHTSHLALEVFLDKEVDASQVTTGSMLPVKYIKEAKMTGKPAVRNNKIGICRRDLLLGLDDSVTLVLF